jgi:hypothetical protein
VRMREGNTQHEEEDERQLSDELQAV